MKKLHGFTIIEVSLFLAITALLFVGITVGTNNSINQQRYSDTVNNFADFLRNVYSEVSNPQSNGKGNSNRAIYGKLITFGEKYNLKGESNVEGIFVYDILGDADGLLSDDSIGTALKSLNASVIGPIEEKQGPSMVKKRYGLAGIVEDYTPRWSSVIEGTARGAAKKASIAIVRHPRSGTITTLVSDSTLQVNENLKDYYGGASAVYNNDGSCASSDCNTYSVTSNFEKSMINGWASFTTKAVKFCVNPFGDSEKRQEIILSKGARNSSGVRVVDLDSTDNDCNK